MTGLYVPGDSVIHRLPPWLKLGILAAFATTLLVRASPSAVTAGAALVMVAYGAAGLGPRILAQQVWPMRWFALGIAALQLIIAEWRQAVVLAGGMVVCVAAANLITLTTRVLDLLDSLQTLLRPLRPVVDPERVALLVALTIRAIPVVSDIITTARQARAARGQEREWRTLLTAVVIGSLRQGDRLAESLAARGMDD